VTDVVDPETRSRMMSGIGGQNTKPEIVVRKALFAAGFRFRLHRKDLPGRPDVVLPGWRVAVFVHGCFWHAHRGCRYAKMPASRREFWEAKLATNVERDRRVRARCCRRAGGCWRSGSARRARWRFERISRNF